MTRGSRDGPSARATRVVCGAEFPRDNRARRSACATRRSAPLCATSSTAVASGASAERPGRCALRDRSRSRPVLCVPEPESLDDRAPRRPVVGRLRRRPSRRRRRRGGAEPLGERGGAGAARPRTRDAPSRALQSTASNPLQSATSGYTWAKRWASSRHHGRDGGRRPTLGRTTATTTPSTRSSSIRGKIGL